MKKYFCISILLFFNLIVSAQHSCLDLTQSDQQKDFLKYLKTTISLLEDSRVKKMMKGYNLDKLSDSNKQQIAQKMMNDTSYFKRLYSYFDFLKILEKKYHISQFSQKEWKEIAQFGAKHGIYFISAMKKYKEPKDSLPYFPNGFPIIPLKREVDTINNKKQEN